MAEPYERRQQMFPRLTSMPIHRALRELRAMQAIVVMVATTLALVLGGAARAAAQAELLQWADPTLGKLMGRTDYRVTFYSDERVEGQDTRLDLTQHNFTLVTPIVQDSRDEWSVSARLRYQDYDTHAVLPDSGQRLPRSSGTYG